MSTEYIYLIQTRECINKNENTFKIGRSRQENCKRLDDYPKGSKVLLCTNCNNCQNMGEV
jgi:hypothetical protein